MVDKMATISKTKLGTRIGRISDEDTNRLNRAFLVPTMSKNRHFFSSLWEA